MSSTSGLGRLCAALILASSSLAAACAGQGAQAADSHGELRLPDLPPIPLPPGARVFGPDGPQFSDPGLTTAPSEDNSVARRAQRPSAGASPPPNASPRTAHADPLSMRRRLLDTLFKRLQKSDDDQEAEGVAGAIERVWLHSGSDTADLLMSRALMAMSAKDYALSQKLLDSVVEIDPDWAEAWNQRATARFLAEDFAGAMVDLDHVLALEPRHFGALTEGGFILRSSGDKKGALLVFQKALQLYPRLAAIRKIVDKLQIEVNGRDI